MTHISQEGGLQAVALLSLISGCHQRALQFLTLVNALRGSDDLRRLALGITVDDGGVTLFPIGDTCCLVYDLIFLMVEVCPSFCHIIEGAFHMFHISRGKDSKRVLEVLVCGWHIIIYAIAVVFLKNKRTSLGIITPHGYLHGLKDEVVLDVTSPDLVEFLQFTLQPFPCSPLNKDRDDQEDYHQHSDAPLQENEPCAF